ncbi:MAG: glycosyltransferase [Motiliproteus sp.]
MAQSIESWLLRDFDRVSTISQSMIKQEKKELMTLMWFFSQIGVCDLFCQKPLRYNRLGNGLGLNEADPILLYSGGLGEKQGLGLVVDAAKTCSEQGQAGCFEIVGEGAAKKRLELQASDLGLNNVRF